MVVKPSTSKITWKRGIVRREHWTMVRSTEDEREKQGQMP